MTSRQESAREAIAKSREAVARQLRDLAAAELQATTRGPLFAGDDLPASALPPAPPPGGASSQPAAPTIRTAATQKALIEEGKMDVEQGRRSTAGDCTNAASSSADGRINGSAGGDAQRGDQAKWGIEKPGRGASVAELASAGATPTQGEAHATPQPVQAGDSATSAPATQLNRPDTHAHPTQTGSAVARAATVPEPAANRPRGITSLFGATSELIRLKRAAEKFQNEQKESELQHAVLQEFDPNRVHETLHYGDSISLIIDGHNALAAFAGGDDGRPWCEILQKGVAVPPNLGDCQWRLQPARHYIESKKLDKFLQQHSDWDEGKGLMGDLQRSVARVRGDPEQFKKLAAEFVQRHKLFTEKEVREVRTRIVEQLIDRLNNLREEREGNTAEEERVRGREIRYGNSVILVHEATGMILTIMKQRALDVSSKRIKLDRDGNNKSALVVHPAFKTHSSGSPISSGDLLTFASKKTISGNTYYLHMGEIKEWETDATEVQRSLSIQHKYITGGQELNAASTEWHPTFFRAMIFKPLKNFSDKSAIQAEDVVTFYHKEKGAFLHYDPKFSSRPFFYESSRVGSKDRKKGHWIWKIESSRLMKAGEIVKAESITASHPGQQAVTYRIKHLITNQYLMQKDNHLVVTDNYLDKATLFAFRPFSKEGTVLHTGELAFLRGAQDQDEWLRLSEEKPDFAHESVNVTSNVKNSFSTLFEKRKIPPDSDALLVQPVQPAALTAVVQVRRLVQTLKQYCERLTALPDSSPLRLPEGLTSVPSFLVKKDETKAPGCKLVADMTADMGEKVEGCLNKLIINCTHGDEETDPMARDGAPNRRMQKMLRELGAIDLAVTLLQRPFQKGVEIDQVRDHPDLKILKNVLNLLYRLLKQSCKEDGEKSRNSKILLDFIPIMRQQLGKGILVTPTLKEIFVNKLDLLHKINEDLVNHFVDLLKENKEPQYIDFLMSVCTIGSTQSLEPVTRVQNMVTDVLLDKNPEILPRVVIEQKSRGGISMRITVRGWKDSAAREFWIDCAQYHQDKVVRSKKEDYVGWIINAPLAQLTQEEKVLRYFIRCTNLYSRLVLGRNQYALSHLILNKALCLSYSEILGVMKETSLPYLLRARYFNLMTRLYVDRNPQSSVPTIVSTRLWCHCKPEMTDLQQVMPHQASIPTCEDNFRYLQTFLIAELRKLAGCKEEKGHPSLNNEPKFGQLEMIRSMLSLTDLLLEYGFFRTEVHDLHVDDSKVTNNLEEGFFRSGKRVLGKIHNQTMTLSADVLTEADAKGQNQKSGKPVQELCRSLYLILDPSDHKMIEEKDVDAVHSRNMQDQSQRDDQSKEARLRNDLRADALNIILRLINYRLNERITFCVKAWEDIFDTLVSQNRLSVLSVSANPMSLRSLPDSIDDEPGAILVSEESEIEGRKEELNSIFSGFDSVMTALLGSTFGQNIISPDVINCDTFTAGDHEDVTVRILLDLSNFKHPQLTQASLAILVRHMSQRTALVHGLRDVQILVFPAAGKVYQETEIIIKRLTELQKLVANAVPEAYDEVTSLLDRMTDYLREHSGNKAEVVRKNQKIMINLGIHTPIRTLLKVYLGRDSSRKDAGEMEVDIPLNAQLRDLFQKCYVFLSFLSRKNPLAQKMLFPFIETWASEHMGIENLNVADTLSEILRDNEQLCSRVREEFCLIFIRAIKDWGRRARWLSFLQNMMVVNNRPIKHMQDMILRLLLDDTEVLLDFSCDYSEREKRFLFRGDERQGKTRMQLMIQNDHRRPFFSLLKYHVTSLQTLASAAIGKNLDNQTRLAGLLNLDKVLQNILDLDKHSDGAKEPQLCPDTVCYVRAAWLLFLSEVFFNCSITADEFGAVQQILSAKRIFTNGLNGKSSSLITYFSESIEQLSERLEKLPDPEKFFYHPESLREFGDRFGKDLGAHVQEVECILRAAFLFFSKWDEADFVTLANEENLGKEQVIRLHNALVALYPAAVHFKSLGNGIIELVTQMKNQGIESNGESIQIIPDQDDISPLQATKERCFQEGWMKFVSFVSLSLGVDITEGQSMNNAIKDLALLFGSRQTFRNENFESLRQLIVLLCDKECDLLFQLTGVKALRVMLYLNPGQYKDKRQHMKSSAKQDEEFQRYLCNETPSDVGSKHFADFQAHLARLGGVDVVTTCTASVDPLVVTACYQLAVTLLDGGNERVQEIFSHVLFSASSGPFFKRMHDCFVESKAAIKNMKRRQKEAESQRTALKRAGIRRTDQSTSKAAAQSLAQGQLRIFEVIKMMRRMCMGHFTKLQDVLRDQRLNHASYCFLSEVVSYLECIEPELNNAFHRDDYAIIDGAVRGFLMLSDSMHGPNFENQKAIADTGIFDLCDRIFARIKFEKHETAEVAQNVARKNLWRSRLKSAVVTCLDAFLEGVQDDAIPNQMLALINWHGVSAQMQSCYNFYKEAHVRHSGSKHDKQVEFETACLKEGIRYYFILIHVRNYDDSNEYINVALKRARDEDEHMMRFFEQRAGYVEIVRNERLERVYFHLPEACQPNGPIENDQAVTAEMYRAPRNDSDKKNKKWIENMCALVEKEMHRQEVRKTQYAFTVTRWDLIRSLNFTWTLVMHIIMVCGGYLPRLGIWQSSPVERYETKVDDYWSSLNSTERRKGGGSGSSDPVVGDVEFSLTAADVFSYESIHPITVWIVRIMSWVNLVLCSLRLFAFIMSELPILVDRYLQENEPYQEQYLPKRAQPRVEEKMEQNLESDFICFENDPKIESDVIYAPNSIEAQEQESSLDQHAPNIERERKRFAAALAIRSMQHEILYFLFPFIAIITDEPIFTTSSLFEICSWAGSKTVIDAIVINFSKMGQALRLGLLFVYTWMVVGILFLYDAHADEMCSNMFQCFMSYVDIAIRDSGVHDLLKPVGEDLRYPHNLFDAFQAQEDTGIFLFRLIWDVTFQIFFVYILLAIVTGIIIDAFSLLKFERDSEVTDLASICFVCNVRRFRVDQYGIGFDKHIKLEHNPSWYLYFLIYLKQKEPIDLTGQERYVYSKVWPDNGKSSIDWLPREQCFTIKSADNEESEVDQMQELHFLAKKMNTMEEQLHVMSQNIAESFNQIHRKLDSMPTERSGPGRSLSMAPDAANDSDSNASNPMPSGARPAHASNTHGHSARSGMSDAGQIQAIIGH